MTKEERETRREEISNYCKRISWSQVAVDLCKEAKAMEEAFLHKVLEKELENREASRRRRLLREAAFPVYKTLETYDFGQIKLPSGLEKEDLVNGSLLRHKRNLILYGSVGTGKSHLATAIGVKACEEGYKVRFFTVPEIIVRLTQVYKEGTLEKTMKKILSADLIIFDEWGYVPVDRQGAQLLFRLIAESYERRSIIITTNIEFSKWGAIFTDDQMAAAMIDRLAHHGHLIVFNGESYRMRHALMKKG